MLLAAGRAAGQMGAQARDRRIGVRTGELQLDVSVELLEALVAADLRPSRAEEPSECRVHVRSLHQLASSSVSSDSPSSSRWPRSLRRASWSVL